jgi:NAD(P)-dependent dehydrogenase (short-subunit alcohol dehydrogenase family)
MDWSRHPGSKGRTVVITGANTGLGFQAAAELARHGAHVVLAVRNLDKGKDACAAIVDGIAGRD